MTIYRPNDVTPSRQITYQNFYILTIRRDQLHYRCISNFQLLLSKQAKMQECKMQVYGWISVCSIVGSFIHKLN